jgi:6,7-dimethyl-8-ribityllumazine synthase
MSSKDKNLSSRDAVSIQAPEKIKIALVTSEWNQEITFAMEEACRQTLTDYGITPENIITERVPGAFELVLGAKWLLSKENPAAVVCIGCVIKGETKHDEYISTSVAHGIMSLGLASGKPVIFGVLTPDDMQQAKDRAGGKHGNKGVEAAMTALKMIALEQQLKKEKKHIGFS